MSRKSIVPFGPQHPVLPEPIHLDLVIEDEKVLNAIPSIGFIHRGLESLVEKKDFNEMVYVAERTCGICSFGHGMGYCEAVEHVMDVDIPPRAKYLRTIWGELSRLHSHLLWLGLMADAFGFESLFYQCWRIREKILDMIEASTGGRVIFSVNKKLSYFSIRGFSIMICSKCPPLDAAKHSFTFSLLILRNRPVSISSENISCIHFFIYIIQYFVIAVCYYRLRLLFEFFNIIYDLTAKERASVLQCRFIYYYSSAL